MVKKVVIIGHDNYGAREIFTSIVDSHSNIEFALIITSGLYYKKSTIASIWHMLRYASFRFCFSRFVEGLKYQMRGDTLLKCAKERHVPFIVSDDVNGEDSHAFIKQFSADLIVSTFTMHILKQKTMDLAKVAAIGCHPSILPHYRGLEVFFWALANGESSSGVSVFYVAEKIDAGRVIMQETFEITTDETVESIYIKLTRICARLLVETIRKFERNETFNIIPSIGKGSYYPMPTKEAYRKFKKTGRRWA